MKIKKAVIPAAGLGTRFLPATKSIPKEMLPIVDKPTIQYIVEEVIASGIEDVLIITGRNKGSIEEHFDRAVELENNLEKNNKEELLEQVRSISKMINIHTVRQKDPKGLGHAVCCAKSFVGNEPFAVLLGDDIVDAKKPCLKQMIEVFEKYNSTIIGVQEVAWDNVNKYGIISGEKVNDNTYNVKDLIEKPNRDKAPTNIAILGRYILTPEIFTVLENTKKGVGGEIQLTDGLKELSNIQDIYAYIFEGRRYDVGSKIGFLEATVDFALKREDLKDSFSSYLSKLNLK
ncbi:UTP--glucose-1-phosphate uridylyltransferase GalU [Sedimentibacter sp. MB31-C6]|uniref:UTP--glucose-1-phosphate uridylyltransferase GalU n=1 Tax=Sedimentibacter sp. MB31-C6 TaxID=3109366 RepID=UPI002DDDAE10|nr:UTP--glucose-1-phosphate uridylyltransferase GalU [Sedimentibacter sp. MB36-C1]WSI05551.1 UTP--glucose-1-phosphate uridylyltransferase GalU [Sedimentibacter sp. MB36-C1]